MSDNLAEQLDQSLAAIQADPSTLPQGDTEIDSLLRLAAQLCDLPRPAFKASLKIKLLQERAPKANAVRRFREGFRTVTPYLAVREANALIKFVKEAFGAEGEILGTGSEGGIHGEFRIGESMLMIGGGTATPKQAALHLYVEDVDATYQRAIRAGATSLMAPTDQDYGDRDAAVKDVAGNHWYIATHQGSQFVPPGSNNLMPYLHPRGADRMIESLKQMLAAKEIARYESPDGVIRHAKVKIGDAIVEMGEAHAEWQPLLAMFYLYVEDVDRWYERAVAGGATALKEPADQPYGDRTAAVTDPFGNVWYLATPIEDVTF